MPRSTVLFVLLLLAGGLAAAERKQTNPDGTPASRVKVDKDDRRQGDFIAWYAGKGHKVREKALYKDDRLDGQRQCFDEAGKLTADETWVAGELVFPKSVALIEAEEARLAAAARAAVAAFADEPWHSAAPKPALMEKMLATVMVDRFLCDMPADIALSRNYIACSQEAAQLDQQLGRQEWDPKKPAGMDDDTFKLAYIGCHQSNLGQGKDPQAVLAGWMWDSDVQVVDRVLHRRCLLNPEIRETGIGVSGDYVALFTGDKGRQEIPEYEVCCYPPRGYFPLERFGEKTAWHASVNPKHYDLIGLETTMDFQVVDLALKPVGSPLAIEYRNVSFDAFGIPGAVIERPKDFVPTKGQLIRVTLGHLKPRDGHPDTLTWYVAFY